MRTLIALLSFSFLAACTQPELMQIEPLDVSGPVYHLNVASVTIAKDYTAPHSLPHVEYLADIPPAEAVRKWASERLIADGQQNSLEVTIKEASILRTDIPKQTTGIEGAFTTEQTEQYNGTLDVEIKIYTPQSALPAAHLEVKAHQLLTLPDDAAPIDREHVYHQMTVELMKQVLPQLDDNIRRYFGNYIMQ